MLRDFVGRMFIFNTTIVGVKGVIKNSTMEPYVHVNYTDAGFKGHLFGMSRYKLTQLGIK